MNGLTKATVIIAVDIGGTKIACCPVFYEQEGLPPQCGSRIDAATPAAEGGEAVYAVVESMIDSLIEQVGTAAGIAVGAAGCVNPEDGSILYANDLMPGWTGIPLRERLQKRFGIPAVVLGDVQAHALGEACWGAGRNRKSSLVVAVGTGIGGAYVLDGKVLRGFHGAAGHIGHTMSTAAGTRTCACGASGHIESVAAGTGIAALYNERMPGRPVDGAQVSELASQGDAKACAVMEESGRALGTAIAGWVNILDPEVIILCGSVRKSGQEWLDAVQGAFRATVLPPMRDTEFFDALLADEAPLIGAAEQFRAEVEL